MASLARPVGARTERVRQWLHCRDGDMAPRDPVPHGSRHKPVASLVALLAVAVVASIVVASGGLMLDTGSQTAATTAEHPPPQQPKHVTAEPTGTSGNVGGSAATTPTPAPALPPPPPQRLKRVAVERTTGNAALAPVRHVTPTSTAAPTRAALVPDYSRTQYKAAIVGRVSDATLHTGHGAGTPHRRAVPPMACFSAARPTFCAKHLSLHLQWFGGRHHWTFEHPYTCPSGCTIVFSMGNLDDADALLYHLAPADMDTSRSMLQRASQRAGLPGAAPQLQVAFAAEFFPPMADQQTLNAFNAEISFRDRSLARDIQYPLEAVARFNRSALAAVANDADVDKLTWDAVAPPMVPIADRIPLANGSISWASNHCNSASGREAYIRELMQHVPVDAYRAPCLKNVPPEKADSSWQQQWESWRRYKFYLAFENSVTADPTGSGDDGYVTEKLYLALVRGQIPVVLGSHHIADHAPPGSYINALDFPSPAALAAHLWQLDRDPDALAEYFQWRHQPFESYGRFFLEALRVSVPIAVREGPDQGGRMFACNLCQALGRWRAAGQPTNGSVPLFMREAAVEVAVAPAHWEAGVS